MINKKNKKMKIISLRLEEDMFNLLQKNATKLNISISDYLRKSIDWIPVKKDSSTDSLLLSNSIKQEVKRVGQNINQIAKNLNIANKNNNLNNEDYKLLIKQLYLIYQSLEIKGE